MTIGFALYTAHTAKAIDTKEVTFKIHTQLKRYYHADGYIKAIGHAAYTTIYSSNDVVRFKWKGLLKRLELIRADAQHKISELRTPAYPPHYQDWLCIHRYEGSWTDNGSPYYGGLQMDIGFQQTYAPDLLKQKGTADHWTPLEQMWTAEKAYKTRGFWPWPNTARACGLL